MVFSISLREIKIFYAKICVDWWIKRGSCETDDTGEWKKKTLCATKGEIAEN